MELRTNPGEWRRGWPVVLGSAAMFATGPALYQNLSSLFIPYLETTLGFSRGEVSSAVALGLLTALAAPLIGRLADRVGVVAIMVASALVLGGAHVMLAMMSGPAWQFRVGIALLALSAPGVSALVFGRLIARRFDAHRGLALGLATTGLSLSTLLAPPLVAHLIEAYGWRAGYLLLAGLALGFGLPLGLVAARAAGQERPATAPIEPTGVRRPSWRDTRFWRLGGATMLINIGTVGMVTQLAEIGRDRGLGLAQAGLLLSAYALSQIVGRLTIGALIDRYAANRMAALYGLISAVGFIALAGGEGNVWVACGLVFVAGLLNGAEFDLLPFFASRLFPLATYSELYGRLLLLSIMGTAGGILSFAWLRDWSGSYTISLTMASIAMLIAAALLFGLPAKPAALNLSASS